MAISVHNPYDNNVQNWLKGNLHTHTNNSDGTRSPQEIVDDYASRGYAFLMLSDHDFLTDSRELDGRGMALIPGHEISADGPHILHAAAGHYIEPDSDRQHVLNKVVQGTGFAVVCHPNWQKHFSHCPQERLEAWEGYTGIEVYNGVIRRLDGSPLATDRWDRLLGLGRKVWGYAVDDSHRPEDVELAWTFVQVETREPAAVVEALRMGRCYPSTGVVIDQIAVEGLSIHVRTQNAQRFVVHSDFGHRETAVDGQELTFTVPPDTTAQYFRIECWGPGEKMAWTQPFYVERA